MAQPITTKDLYNDSGELKKLIAELEAATAAYKTMVDTIKGEAIKLEVSLKSVNAATAQGRKETVKAAKTTDEMQKQVEKYNKAIQESAVDLEEAKRAVAQLNRVNKAQARINASLEGSYDQLSAQYTLNKIKLNAMSKEMRAAGGVGEKLEKSTKAIYEEMNRLQKATGKNQLQVGNYELAIKALPGPLARWANELTGIKTQLGQGKTALISMISRLGLFKVALASTGIGLIIIALGALYTNLTRTQKGIDFVNRIMAGLGATLDVVIDRLAKFGGAIIKLLTGDIKGAFTDVKSSISGMGTEIVEEFKKGKEIEGTMQGIKEEAQKLEVQTARTRAEIKKLNLVAEDTTKGTKQRSRAAKLAFDLEKNLQSQREDLIKREVNAIKDKNALGETLFEDAQILADKERELFTTQQESIELQTTLQNKLNTIRNEGINKEKAAATATKEQQDAIRALAVEIENGNAKLGGTASVARLEYDRAIAKIKELKAEAKGLGAELNFDNLELIEESKLLRSLDGILGDTETLQPELNELGKIAGLSFKSGLAESLSEPLPKDLGKKAIAQAKKIKAEGQSIFEQDVQESGLFAALGFKFGLNDDEVKAASIAIQFVGKQLTQLADLRKKVADENTTNANNEVSALQRTLQTEIESRNAGFANKAATVAKELALAKDSQKKALKEQAAAAKQQQVIQTIEQGSNLVTAAAKILTLKGANPLFTIPLVAIMFGAFAAAKLKASSLVKKKEFAKGGLEIIGGGTHASGNDTALGFESEGKQAYAERNEAHLIVNNKQAPKYKSILPLIAKTLNDGTFESHFEAVGKAASDIPMFIGTSSDNSKMENLLATIANNSRSKEQYFTDSSGKMVRIRGNVKTTFA